MRQTYQQWNGLLTVACGPPAPPLSERTHQGHPLAVISAPSFGEVTPLRGLPLIPLDRTVSSQPGPLIEPTSFTQPTKDTLALSLARSLASPPPLLSLSPSLSTTIHLGMEQHYVRRRRACPRTTLRFTARSFSSLAGSQKDQNRMMGAS